LVVVDLFTRETILSYLRNRNQDNVAKALIKNIIFQRGVPVSLRTDNAPELSSTTGAVSAVCKYLNIKQIRTGGHNPRGNAICERVNQSLGAMIRKLNDYEYGKIEQLALPAFQFALNTSYLQFSHRMYPVRGRPWTQCNYYIPGTHHGNQGEHPC
jgi:transposase InsO family protein